ncbi:Internalin-J precursor [Listeria grayi]|uniref:Internalin-J n=1 Tax=Listeria grayi TaxID=1641 RepID=A0A378MGA0_LISGR|nr:Internalin-J precursor [Listeria grayi]
MKYEDEKGNELAPSEKLSGKLDAPYETTAKNIVGWTVKTTPNNAQGVFTDKEQTVTYVYEKADGASVTVKYEDEKGNELAPSEKLSGKLDAPYETTAKNIAGWTVKTTPNNAQGTFTDKEQTVTYVYEKADGASVTVKYEDDKGNELAPSEKRSGKLDAPYETTAKNIVGWTVKTTPINAQGTFTDKEQTVTYVYEKADGASVTVKYEDDKGNELAPSEILSGKLDAPYETTAKNIAGWKLVAAPSNAEGKFTAKEQTVVYVYKKASDKNKPSVPKKPDKQGDKKAKPTKKTPKKNYKNTPKNQKNDPEKIHLPSTGDVWMDSAIYILAGLSALIAGAVLIRRRKHV